MENEIQQGRASPAGLSTMYADYISFLDVSERTIQTYKGNLRQFIRWTQENGIERPTRADILKYRDYLREKCKPNTVQGYITALRLFFIWTEQAGLYPNIANHVKGARIDKAHKKDYLTAAQVRQVLQEIDTDTAAGKRDFLLIAFMVTGGARCAELSSADVEDLEEGKLYLQSKGKQERTDYIKIVPQLVGILDAYTAILRPDPDHRNPLFVSFSNNSRRERLSPRSVSGLVKQRLVSAGFDSPRITAHSLRHSAVTLALQGGESLQAVQQFARHQNITTTQIYMHNLERERNQSEHTIAGLIF